MKIGNRFNSIEEAVEFLESYGKLNNFPVKHVRKSKRLLFIKCDVGSCRFFVNIFRRFEENKESGGLLQYFHITNADFNHTCDCHDYINDYRKNIIKFLGKIYEKEI